MSSEIKMSPPHISDMPQPYLPPPGQQPPYEQVSPGQQPPYYNQQGAQGVQGIQNASVVAQNYRDQLFAQCAMGNHERKTEYGVFGIVTAVACFPCGLICLFLNRKKICSRCGVSLDMK